MSKIELSASETYKTPKWREVVAGLTAIVALSACSTGTSGNTANAAPDKEPSASSTATQGTEPIAETPSPTETTESPEQAVSGQFGISAAEFESNPELLGQEYYSQFNEFMIAGIDYEVSMADERFVAGDEPYLAELTAPINAEFVEDLFVDDWQFNPNLSEYVPTIISIASRTRQLRLMSYTGGPESTPYFRETVVESIETTPAPNITTSIRWTERDNGAETSVADNMDGPDVNSFYGGETFVWKNVDGQMKISDLAHYDG